MSEQELPVNLGDVPNWLQAIGGLAQLAQAIWAERQRRAAEWAKEVQDQSGMSDDGLAARVRSDPRVGEMVEFGVEAAARSALHDKRWLLARVVAAALSETDDTAIDRLPFFLRAVQALEPPHVRLLVLLSTPRPGQGRLAGTSLEGAYCLEDLEEEWPQAADVFRPMLSVLEREGLVEDIGHLLYAYQPTWTVTRFARDFLRFLPGGPLPWPPLDKAEVVARYVAEGRPAVWVKNLGPALARELTVEGPTRDDGEPLLQQSNVMPLHLEPGEQRELLTLAPSLGFMPPYRIRLRWLDDVGEREWTGTVDKP